MNKQQLAAKIWASANKMRSKIEANDYKDYILGFMFYKFLSDKEKKYLLEHDWEEEELPELIEEDTMWVTQLQTELGYFISYEHLFSTWIKEGTNFEAGQITDAISAFNRNVSNNSKSLFDNIFNTLETGLSKLGDTAATRTKSIRDLLYLINDIPMDGKQDYDVLGFIYEYLISNFAANAGKKAGEFYTPHEVSLLMSEIIADYLQDRKTIDIYDPTSGSGSLLLNIGKSISRYHIEADNIKYFAQELKSNTYNLTRMNLIMRGISHNNIFTRNADTLEHDWPIEINQPYKALYLDAVVSNPPYSQHWSPEDKENDPRYARFGLAPKGKADYAFLLHDLYHLKPNGIMAIVLPHGVLFRGSEEGTIRKNLIEENHIDTVIGLPANIFFGTGIPTIIMILKQKRENTDVLIIDASKGFEKAGKNNRLRASDIRKIVDTVKARKNMAGFANVVSREEIRQNDYNLNIPRYVDSTEKAESYDMYALMYGGLPNKEIDAMQLYWDAFPHLKNELFASVNEAYSKRKAENLKATIETSADVAAWKAQYKDSFASFSYFFETEILEKADTLPIMTGEEILNADIKKRVQEIPLIDRYEAYQILYDAWADIALDIEIIQTEGGWASIRVVEPKYVMKKKNGKDVEVQEGWKGRIFPFELVQQELLFAEYQAVQEKENRQNEIAEMLTGFLEELSEEDKEKDFVNDAGDAFVVKEVKAVIKAGEEEPEILSMLRQVDKLFSESKELKKELKIAQEALEKHTKETIENLSETDGKRLLQKKWVSPLEQSFQKIPENVLKTFIKGITHIEEKYATTLRQVDEEISQTEKEFANILDDLVGDSFDMQGIAELKKLLGGE